MLTRRSLFGLAAGAVVAPVLPAVAIQSDHVSAKAAQRLIRLVDPPIVRYGYTKRFKELMHERLGDEAFKRWCNFIDDANEKAGQ